MKNFLLLLIVAGCILAGALSIAGTEPDKAKEAFDTYGCSGCHVPGKDWNGPDLTYVTENRPKDWIIDFILNPKKHYDEPMVKDMIEAFNLHMPEQGVEPKDAELIYEYLKSLAKPAERKEEKRGEKKEKK
ncbi:MAG: c-type cytochrome [Nitrospirae bacterium]|nr:c-type cytochrome [Nitrospirota bacterium]